jgi:5-methylcytosine-specific restriction endonuclease McrA
MMPRRHLKKTDKVDILAKSNGKCAACGGAFTKADPAQFDHTIALELGGADTNENMRAIHGDACHKPKTAADVKAIAKGKRQRKKFGPLRGTVPVRFKAKIKSRGFDKSRTRKLDGTVVPHVGKADLA